MKKGVENWLKDASMITWIYNLRVKWTISRDRGVDDREHIFVRARILYSVLIIDEPFQLFEVTYFVILKYVRLFNYSSVMSYDVCQFIHMFMYMHIRIIFVNFF